MQSDVFNSTRLRTFIAVALTSNLGLADLPGNVRLSREATGLERDSVANVTQIITGDRSVLSECVGELAEREIRKLEAGLRLVLDL